MSLPSCCNMHGYRALGMHCIPTFYRVIYKFNILWACAEKLISKNRQRVKDIAMRTSAEHAAKLVLWCTGHAR